MRNKIAFMLASVFSIAWGIFGVLYFSIQLPNWIGIVAGIHFIIIGLVLAVLLFRMQDKHAKEIREDADRLRKLGNLGS